ncbi:hypothetical protein K439DRAFT_1637756 [Ramaria rubella]|nr:hypothetical protein K439DRAFT_1637756 [Ramaria rubella]
MVSTTHYIYSAFYTVNHLHTRRALCIRSAPYSVSRGGMNLTRRHARIKVLPPSLQHLAIPGQENRSLPTDRIFRGLNIPRKPRPPTPQECCMSRCETCVYDLYVTSLQRYRRDLAAFRNSLTNMQVPSRGWPVKAQSDDPMGEAHLLEEELNAREAARHALRNMNNTDARLKPLKSKTKDVWLETVKLVVWVLRGCRG